jgi:hypothetical protein
MTSPKWKYAVRVKGQIVAYTTTLPEARAEALAVKGRVVSLIQPKVNPSEKYAAFDGDKLLGCTDTLNETYQLLRGKAKQRILKITENGAEPYRGVLEYGKKEPAKVTKGKALRSSIAEKNPRALMRTRNLPMRNPAEMLGSSPSLEMMAKLIEQYTYSKVRFEPIDPNTWAVYYVGSGRKAKLEVKKHGKRYRFFPTQG